MLTAKCIGGIESQREGTVVSHISRKTSEMWAPGLRQGTRDGKFRLVHDDA